MKKSGYDIRHPRSPGLTRLIWLARRCPLPPSPLRVFSPMKLHAQSKRTTTPAKGGSVFGQGYRNRWTPLLEPPSKLSRVKLAALYRVCSSTHSSHHFHFFEDVKLLSCILNGITITPLWKASKVVRLQWLTQLKASFVLDILRQLTAYCWKLRLYLCFVLMVWDAVLSVWKCTPASSGLTGFTIFP